MRQLLAYAQQLISENFPKPAAIESRQPPPPRLYQGVPWQRCCCSVVCAGGHAERTGEPGRNEDVARNQIVANDLRVERAGLEDAFVELTGRKLAS